MVFGDFAPSTVFWCCAAFNLTCCMKGRLIFVMLAARCMKGRLIFLMLLTRCMQGRIFWILLISCMTKGRLFLIPLTGLENEGSEVAQIHRSCASVNHSLLFVDQAQEHENKDVVESKMRILLIPLTRFNKGRLFLIPLIRCIRGRIFLILLIRCMRGRLTF